MKELFDLAYAFRNSKIWKSIYEDELFAVRLPDGGTGYCCITGRIGEHMSLSVYPGAEGFSTYRGMQELDLSFASPVDLLMQNCVQCSLESRNQLGTEEIRKLRAYCKSTGKPLREPFPQFTRFLPHCVPWHIREPADWEALRAALEVVVELAGRDKAELGLRPIGIDTDGEEYIPTDEALDRLDEGEEAPQEPVTVPLYSIVDGELRIDRVSLPPYVKPQYAAPTRFDEAALRKLTGLPQCGALQCEVIRLPEPIEGDPPYLPAALMMAGEDRLSLRPALVTHAEYDPNEMLEEFVRILIDNEIYPEKLLVRTSETMAILKEFGKRAKVKIVKRKRLDLLDDAIDDMLDHFDENDDMSEEDMMDEMLEMLEDMSVEQIRKLPAAFAKDMLEMEAELPAEIVAKLRKAMEK